MPPSKLPKYRYLQCSRPCPSGASRLRSYQSIAIYCVRASAQVGCPTTKFTQVSLLIVFARLPNRGVLPSKLARFFYLQCSHPCPGGVSSLRITKALQFTLFLPRWGVPLSKLPKHRYLQCSCPCTGGLPKHCYFQCSRPCPGGDSHL